MNNHFKKSDNNIAPLTQSGAYGRLSIVYDRLNAELDYAAWADFILACFERYADIRPSILLDLACGTGRMTLELAQRGYEMIGVDGSAEMLSEASSRRLSFTNPLYLMQDMRRFELYGSVGGVVCCLDSINYLVDDGDLETCFACVANYLEPGGLFVFDVSSEYRFKHIFADNAYVLEDDGVYCGWQNYYHAGSRRCDFFLSVFCREHDGSYSRFDEQQTERYYSPEQLEAALRGAGLEPVGRFGGYGFEPVRRDDERWYFIAKKPQSISK